jgi:hypothetical protein
MMPPNEDSELLCFEDCHYRAQEEEEEDEELVAYIDNDTNEEANKMFTLVNMEQLDQNPQHEVDSSPYATGFHSEKAASAKI